MIKRTLSVIAMVTMMGNAGNVAADDSKLLQMLVLRYKALQTEVLALKPLQSEVTALTAEVAALTAALETKQDAMDCLYQVGNDLYVDACNLHVQDGTGVTQGYPNSAPNGLGNLIVGYNEDNPDGSEKTGSHNVIVGAYHTYTNRSGLVTGTRNTIIGFAAAVIGGSFNVASGVNSTVSGGVKNEASGPSSSVSGGQQNEASAYASSVNG